MDGEASEADPPLPSINTSATYAQNDTLSANLSRLSLNTPSQTPLPDSPASDAANTKRLASSGVNTPPRAAAGPSRRASGFRPTDKAPTSPQLRRKSSNNSLLQRNDSHGTPPRGSPYRSASYSNSAQSLLEEPVQHTASSIASEHFKKELALHDGSNIVKSQDTLVIIHDSCYGHRYSRPKTSKNTLSLIVERPERLQASVLGIASAYVRLGSMYAEGKHPLSPHQDPSEDVPFAIQKTVRSLPITSSAVTNVHGTKWMQELKAMCDSAEAKLSSGGKELSRPETPNTPVGGKTKLHEGDLYLCKESLNAFEGALGGVLDGVDAVFRRDTATKKAFVCIRPPGHHCSSDLPSGFCWINNVHVGIEHAAQAHGLTHAAIIDFDLHHGDGSQSITWDRNAKAARATKSAPISKKTSIGYFSLHDINSYPCEWGDKDKVQNASVCLENAHGQNIWNIHLQPWTTEEEFWDLYRDQYSVLIDKARTYLCRQSQRIRQVHPNVEPKAAIFISAGFDASEYEGGGMQRHGANVPSEFYARISTELARLAEEIDTSCQGRIISVLEGGYSNNALTSGVMSHVTGLVANGRPVSSHVGLQVNHEEIMSPMSNQTTRSGFVAIFDNTWWNRQSLSQLETLQNPTQPPVQPKKPRNAEAPTYTSPTQSFTAKVIDPSKIRSMSGTMYAPERSRPATPPPPDVDWATAAYELSKLLIPQDRQINSCKHEELTEPRVKREKAPSTVTASKQPVSDQVQTRGRKGRAAYRESEVMGPTAQTVTEENRRRTTSDLPLPLETDGLPQATNSDGPSRDQSARPSTATSNTASSSGDGFKRPPSIGTAGAPRSRPPSRPTTSGPELSVGRTRRSSGAKPDLNRAQSYSNGSVALKTSSALSSVRDLSPAVSQSSNASKPVVASKAEKADMDKLTSGVKKITLRMGDSQPSQPLASNDPNKVENPLSRNGRKPVIPKDPAKPATSRAANLKGAKAPTKTKQNGPLVDTAPNVHTTQVGSAAHTEVLAPPTTFSSNATVGASTAVTYDIPHSTSSSNSKEVNGSAGNQTAMLTGAETADQQLHTPLPATVPTASNLVSSEFIPYMPEEPPAAYAENPSQAPNLTWLPPNTSTPIATPVKKTKEDLPVFTPQSKILFGAPAAGLNDTSVKYTDPPATESKMDMDGSEAVTTAGASEGKTVWDVPDTPAQHQ